MEASTLRPHAARSAERQRTRAGGARLRGAGSAGPSPGSGVRWPPGPGRAESFSFVWEPLKPSPAGADGGRAPCGPRVGALERALGEGCCAARTSRGSGCPLSRTSTLRLLASRVACHSARPPPAPAGEGGRVARESQRVLVPSALAPTPAPDPAALAPAPAKPSEKAAATRGIRFSHWASCMSPTE